MPESERGPGPPPNFPEMISRKKERLSWLAITVFNLKKKKTLVVFLPSRWHWKASTAIMWKWPSLYFALVTWHQTHMKLENALGLSWRRMFMSALVTLKKARMQEKSQPITFWYYCPFSWLLWVYQWHYLNLLFPPNIPLLPQRLDQSDPFGYDKISSSIEWASWQEINSQRSLTCF